MVSTLDIYFHADAVSRAGQGRVGQGRAEEGGVEESRTDRTG